MVYLAGHRSGFLPENFGHVQKLRVEIKKSSAREAIRKWTGIGCIEVELIGKCFFYDCVEIQFDKKFTN